MVLIRSECRPPDNAQADHLKRIFLAFWRYGKEGVCGCRRPSGRLCGQFHHLRAAGAFCSTGRIWPVRHCLDHHYDRAGHSECPYLHPHVCHRDTKKREYIILGIDAPCPSVSVHRDLHRHHNRWHDGVWCIASILYRFLPFFTHRGSHLLLPVSSWTGVLQKTAHYQPQSQRHPFH